MRGILLIASLLLVGCSQEYLDRKNADRDDAYCQSIGIQQGDSRYANCRYYAASLRTQKEQTDAATGLGMLGIGSGVIQSNRQTPMAPQMPVTCVQQGVFTTCQ